MQSRAMRSMDSPSAAALYMGSGPAPLKQLLFAMLQLAEQAVVEGIVDFQERAGPLLCLAPHAWRVGYRGTAFIRWRRPRQRRLSEIRAHICADAHPPETDAGNGKCAGVWAGCCYILAFVSTGTGSDGGPGKIGMFGYVRRCFGLGSGGGPCCQQFELKPPGFSHCRRGPFVCACAPRRN